MSVPSCSTLSQWDPRKAVAAVVAAVAAAAAAAAATATVVLMLYLACLFDTAEH